MVLLYYTPKIMLLQGSVFVVLVIFVFIFIIVFIFIVVFIFVI